MYILHIIGIYLLRERTEITITYGNNGFIYVTSTYLLVCNACNSFYFLSLY